MTMMMNPSAIVEERYRINLYKVATPVLPAIPVQGVQNFKIIAHNTVKSFTSTLEFPFPSISPIGLQRRRHHE